MFSLLMNSFNLWKTMYIVKTSIILGSAWDEAVNYLLLLHWLPIEESPSQLFVINHCIHWQFIYRDQFLYISFGYGSTFFPKYFLSPKSFLKWGLNWVIYIHGLPIDSSTTIFGDSSIILLGIHAVIVGGVTSW